MVSPSKLEIIKHRKHGLFSKIEYKRQITNYINYNKEDKLLKLEKNKNQPYNVDRFK